MNKATYLIVTAGMIAVILLFLYRVNLAKTHQEPNRGCQEVSVDNHIYRGQCLPEGYKPAYLVPLSARDSWLDTKQYLDIRAEIVFDNVIKDAEKDGMCLVVSSGYRSVEEQQKLLDIATDKDIVARPNESEHQTGLAVDFVACPMRNGVRDDRVERLELKNDFDTLPEYKWLQDNADRYDIEQSFRADNIDKAGYPVESWHWKLIIK